MLTPEEKKIFSAMSDRGDYVDIPSPPYSIVLDGRFSIEELEVIVKVAKENDSDTQANKASSG